MSDRDLIEAVVCLANAEGGELWLGWKTTAPPPACMLNTSTWPDWQGLVAAPPPSLAVIVTPVNIGGVPVAHIAVPRAEGTG